MEIEYNAGYYEWHLKINGKLCYVEGDTFTDSLAEEHMINGQILASEAESFAQSLVDYIRYQFIEDEDYQASQSWIQTAIEEESYNPIEILKSLSDDNWDTIQDLIFEAYSCYYGIKDRRFKYNGEEFEPIGNILGGWNERSKACVFDDSNPSITKKKINRQEFYKVAKKNHASCDVYRVIGDYENYYILGNENFIKVNLKDCKFKACDQYSKWYQ